jgi:hypothetical protein
MMISVTYIQYMLPTGCHLEEVPGRNLLHTVDLRLNTIIILLIGCWVRKWGVWRERQKNRQKVVHSGSIAICGGLVESQVPSSS